MNPAEAGRKLKLSPGQRVRIVQRIIGGAATWRTCVEGIVESCEEAPTGSWHAHGKNDRLWLQRVRLRKADGELTSLVIDPQSEVRILSPQDSG